MLVSLQPDFVLIHRLTRRGPARSLVTCEWLYHPDAISEPGFDPEPAIEFWDETNRQDWEICERSQRGVSSRAYTPGPYSSLETMLPVIDSHYLAAMS
jgi:Rieske 2Fe-2S family protein